MERVKCIVCGRERARSEAEIMVLTEQEKAQIRKVGQTPQEEVAYCRPCHRIMTDPQSALDLIKGTLILRLRAAGVQNAEQVAEKYRVALLAKTKRSS